MNLLPGADCAVRPDLPMKKLIIILSLGLCAAAFAQTVPPTVTGSPPPANDIIKLVDRPKHDPKPQPADDLAAKLKDAEARALTLATQSATQQVQIERLVERLSYFQKLADVNQLAVKLVGDELAQFKTLAADLQRQLDLKNVPPPPAK